MTPHRWLASSGLSVFFASVLLQACSGSSPGTIGGGGPPPGVYCSAKVAEAEVCYGYSNLTADQQSAVAQDCTQSLDGSVVSSCPGGQIGCCSLPTGGYTTTECYYQGDPSSLQAGCKSSNGTWSGSGDSDGGASGSSGGSSGSGSGGSGSSGSGSSSGGSGSGSSGGGTCTGAQVQCPKGCADLQTDVNNCGSCGYRCPAGAAGTAASCVAGTCKYTCSAPGETLCSNGSGSGYCTDLATDTYNCGQCNDDCEYQVPSGTTASCQNGTCQASCPAGQALCNGSCIDVTGDPANCGSCGHACGANTVCQNGSCVAGCSNGETLCSGVCANLQTDSSNCGQCGNPCPYTANSCVGGQCTCEVSCVDQVGDPYCCSYGQSCYQNGCM